MRTGLLLLVAQLVACGGGGASGGDDGGAGDDDGSDAAADCGVIWQDLTWEKVPLPAIDEPWPALIDGAPLNAGRAVRVEVAVEMGYCIQNADLAAMPRLTFTPEAEEVFIENVAWQPVGQTDCTDALLVMRRSVSLDLVAGSWTIHIGNPPTHTLSVTVDPAPARACDTTTSPCEMDCDCPDGQSCVGVETADGWSTTCATPCTHARDCGGQGICNAEADAPFTCVPGVECTDTLQCRSGYSCVDGSCLPDVQLGAATRVPCTCDADCQAPLKCIEPEYPDGVRRCELTCPTAGPWCNGPHFCGNASQDVAGLAAADSICVFAGE